MDLKACGDSCASNADDDRDGALGGGRQPGSGDVSRECKQFCELCLLAIVADHLWKNGILNVEADPQSLFPPWDLRIEWFHANDSAKAAPPHVCGRQAISLAGCPCLFVGHTRWQRSLHDGV